MGLVGQTASRSRFRTPQLTRPCSVALANVKFSPSGDRSSVLTNRAINGPSAGALPRHRRGEPRITCRCRQESSQRNLGTMQQFRGCAAIEDTTETKTKATFSPTHAAWLHRLPILGAPHCTPWAIRDLKAWRGIEHTCQMRLFGAAEVLLRAICGHCRHPLEFGAFSVKPRNPSLSRETTRTGP